MMIFLKAKGIQYKRLQFFSLLLFHYFLLDMLENAPFGGNIGTLLTVV